MWTAAQAAVLENMHAALCYELLRPDANNWAKDFPEERYNTVRKLMIDSIMATDMKVHFELTESLTRLSEDVRRERERGRSAGRTC